MTGYFHFFFNNISCFGQTRVLVSYVKKSSAIKHGEILKKILWKGRVTGM